MLPVPEVQSSEHSGSGGASQRSDGSERDALRTVSQQDADLEDPFVGSTTNGRSRKVSRLTDYDKSIIARRAYGEYAIDEICTKIWRTHGRKNRNPDDQVYVKFLRVVYGKKAHTWDEYESAAQPIVDLHPDPWGTATYREERELAERKQAKKRNRTPPVPKEKKRDEQTGLLVDEDGMVFLPPDWEL
jgi:hypothetical protein